MSVEVPRPCGYGRQWNQTLAETGWWHSFELPDGSEIRGVNNVDGLKMRIRQFPIAENLVGKRVLDVGAWDGWFSFEMERRGADVLAIDCWTNPRFREIHSLLKSKVEFREMDVYDLSPETVGRFDIVLFMGVLYHLKHPLLALERICSVTSDMAAVDSYVLASKTDPKARPVLELYETDEFEGNIDNWVAPNLAGLLAMCRTAGFARVDLRKMLPFSACVACFRKWESGISAHSPVIELLAATHDMNQGINFSSKRDEYLSAYLKTSEKGLGLDEFMPQVGGFGVRPIYAKPLSESVWQLKFKLPPGLPAGWHHVCLRVKNGPPSNVRRIAIDVPLGVSTPVISGLRDSATWQANELNLTAGSVVAIWVRALPENADRHNVGVTMDRENCDVEFVSESAGDDARQVNIRVRQDLTAGLKDLVLQSGDQSSEPVPLNVVRN